MQLIEIKNIYHKELDELYPTQEVDSFFYLLIEHYLGLERFILALQPNLTISKEEEQPLFEALAQLRLQRPVQYIMGKAYFMGLDFEVDENVLIPRPETEELVRWILERFKVQGSELKVEVSDPTAQKTSFKILDIGTGSGCIAISLAKNLLEAKVYALDISKEALEVAKRNAELNGVTITFINGDILQDANIDEKFDVIVSNPPYVRQLEKKEMSANVLRHEPGLALYVSDENPLIFYKTITEFAQVHLNKTGALFLEINQYLPKETEQLLEANNFKDIELRKDMFGNYRMLKGKAP